MANFQSFDLFPKLHDDIRINIKRTLPGGILFGSTLLLMILLIFNEIYTTLIKQQLNVSSFVDTLSIEQRIRTNINITLHHVPCDALGLDIQDVTGSYLEDVQYTLHKLRLDEAGQFINQKQSLRISTMEKSINYPSNPVMRALKRWRGNGDQSNTTDDCYGAELYEGQRCTTCQDVLLAFANRDWPGIQFNPHYQQHHLEKQLPNATMKIDNFERQFQELMSQQQDEMLENISKQLMEIEESEKQNLEYEQNLIDTGVLVEQQQPILKEVLSDDQKKYFRDSLMQLQEINHNPMQWNDERLKEEKGSTIESLMNILNVSLTSYTEKLYKQVRFMGRETVYPEKRLPRIPFKANLTRIERTQCENKLNISLRIESDSQENLNSSIYVMMEEGVCQLVVGIATSKNDGTELEVDFIFGDQATTTWKITRSTIGSIIKHVNLTIIGAQSYESIFQRSLVDKTHNTFKFSLYVQIANDDGRRVLYVEDFQLHEVSKVIHPEDASAIEEHINEGCQIFGHLFVKKVPGTLRVGFSGRGQSAKLLNRQFSISHSIHLLEFTDQHEELSLGKITPSTNTLDGTVNGGNQHSIMDDQSMNYYLKIVNSIYEPMWGAPSKINTFTSHHQMQSSEGQLPQVLFRYEFDGISMKYQSLRKSLLDLIVNLLAIVGGLFAVSQLASKVLQVLGL